MELYYRPIYTKNKFIKQKLYGLAISFHKTFILQLFFVTQHEICAYNLNKTTDFCCYSYHIVKGYFSEIHA